MNLLFLDMDNVLTNWDLGTNHVLKDRVPDSPGKFEERMQTVGITPTEMWKAIRGTENYWAGLPCLPHSRRLVTELKKLGELRICTSAGTPDSTSRGPGWEAYTASLKGKIDWLEATGITDVEMVPIQAKYLLSGEGRILIDDMSEQLDPWVEHGGVAIEFPCRQSGHDIPHGQAVDWTITQVTSLMSGGPAQSRLVQFDGSSARQQ